MNKTKSKIMKLLENEKGNWLKAPLISEKIGVSYETTSKNLKKMREERLLKREAFGRPWNYYYQLNKYIITK